MMAQADLFMSEVGERSGSWLRSQFAGSRAKHVANLLDLSERQAKRLLGGAPPTLEQFGRLAQHFGWGYVQAMLEPVVGTPAMHAEMREMEARLALMIQGREIEDARGALAVSRMGAGTAGAGSHGDRPAEAQADSVAPDTRSREGRS